MTAPHVQLDVLRQSAREWRKRGLLDPASLHAMVEARIYSPGTQVTGSNDPTYADFFTAA